MLEKLVNRLQQAYNNHRAPETWGTPQVSAGFFDHLRSGHFYEAWNYLVNKEKTMGDQSARPEIKAIANLLASTLLILGVREMSGINNDNKNKLNPLSIKTMIGVYLFELTLKLLFFSQGGQIIHTGYLGKDPSDWNQLYTATLTEEEQQKVREAYDPSIDGCEMDVIARLYPEKLIPYFPDKDSE